MNQNFEKCNGIIHVVKKGDTLYKISRMHNVNLSDIISANPYVNVYNMQVGEEICVPVQGGCTELTYTVKDGDTFEDVMRNLGTDPDDLFRLNLDLYKVMLTPGMVIKGTCEEYGIMPYNEE